MSLLTVLALAGVGTTAVAIGTEVSNSLVTHFGVTGNILNTKVNDILSVGTERVKVLNVDLESSRIRVLRAVDGTVSTAHTIGKYLLEDPRKLLVNVGFLPLTIIEKTSRFILILLRQ